MRPFVCALALLPLVYAAPSSSPLMVRTSTGVYHGRVDQNFSDVREFLNVPYAQSTAGKNRFMPPKAVNFSSKRFDATDYPPFCPQYVSSNPAIWNKQIPQYLSLWSYNGSFFAPENFQTGEPATFASEDCLSLAIWTPKNATSVSQLPVALFWTGGGYQTNGVLVPGQLPPRWVSRTQEHVVVTINYRMNILGFPNSGALQDQNLGLLDQRMSLEWVRDNIVHFGGDPSRIMIWGQSAGAGSVDFYNFAYWNDPIAHGIFAESGNAYTGAGLTDPEHTNFTFVAKNVGCDFPNNYEEELDCMQKVDANKLIAFMGHYQDAASSQTDPSGKPKISFSVTADERTAFQNNTDRYPEGFVSQIPVIYSGVANEGGSLSPYPIHNVSAGPWQPGANAITESLSLCTGANTTILRNQYNLTTYRYQYAGNWTNQDPLPWMGAFHSSDLSMLFGSYAYTGSGGPHPQVTVSHPAGSSLEIATSESMQDHILAFMKDPYTGPPSMGWMPAMSGKMLRFGADGKAVQTVEIDAVEAVCFGKGTYDPFP